jgi:hypothetical protein
LIRACAKKPAEAGCECQNRARQFDVGKPFLTGPDEPRYTSLATWWREDGRIRGQKAGISEGIVPSSWNLRQKRHNPAAAVQDKHLSAGIVAKLSDNADVVSGIVALRHE